MKFLLTSALIVCSLIAGGVMAQTHDHPVRQEMRREQIKREAQQENKENPRHRREHRRHREYRRVHREQHKWSK